MFRLMLEEGCPPPVLEADGGRVLCVLRINPRTFFSAAEARGAS